jgi:hypothetical protein
MNGMPQPGNGSIGSQRSTRLLGGAFWVLAVLGLLGLVWTSLLPPTPREHIEAGLELASAGEDERAVQEFLAAAGSGDTIWAAMAYHNLASLAVRRALSNPGTDAEASALEAVGFAEASLTLSPGSEGAARNLELALRRLRESPTEQRLRSPERSGQQPGAIGADTDDEVVGRRAEMPGRDPGSEHELSREEAVRLLASFRLMERSGVLEAIRDQIGESSPRGSTRRRGPPW